MQKSNIKNIVKSILIGLGTSIWVLPFWACLDILLDVVSDIYRADVIEKESNLAPFDIEMMARPFLAWAAIFLMITLFTWSVFLYRRLFSIQTQTKKVNED